MTTRPGGRLRGSEFRAPAAPDGALSVAGTPHGPRVWPPPSVAGKAPAARHDQLRELRRSRTLIVARSVRAAVLAERELGYIDAAPGPRGEPGVHHGARDPAQCPRGRPRRVRRASGVRGVRRRDPQLHRRRVQPPTPDWGRQISEHYGLLGGGLLGVWAVAFPVAAIATLVVGISLIVDGLANVLDRAP